MRAHVDRTEWFFGGVATGAAVTAVAFLAIEAIVRRRQIAREPILRIDGVHELKRAELGARPQEEGNATMERLESEAPDLLDIEERW